MPSFSNFWLELVTPLLYGAAFTVLSDSRMNAASILVYYKLEESLRICSMVWGCQPMAPKPLSACYMMAVSLRIRKKIANYVRKKSRCKFPKASLGITNIPMSQIWYYIYLNKLWNFFWFKKDDLPFSSLSLVGKVFSFRCCSSFLRQFESVVDRSLITTWSSDLWL